MWGPVLEAVGHSYIKVSYDRALVLADQLTNLWKIFQDGALHGQLVKISVQEGGDALGRHVFGHLGSWPDILAFR